MAVVGGGRWGRVIVSVLAEMNLPFDRIVVVTRANSQSMALFLETQCSKASLPFNIVPSLDELFANYHVGASVVVNAAHQHFDTSYRLIDQGVNVLIEKPLALSSKHVQTLLDKAMDSGVCLIPGLQYRFCSYIHHFAKLLSLSKKKPHNFFVKWSDQAGETRYGETKTYDHSIDVAQDVMPHVWTILSTIFGKTSINIESCQSKREGRYADFSVEMEGAQGHIALERDATQRQRIISVKFDANESLSIDFSREPGLIYLNGKSISADPDWEKNPRPLARQLDYFLEAIAKGFTSETDKSACLDSVFYSERASVLLAKNRLELQEDIF